jgi:hypothetical protein
MDYTAKKERWDLQVTQLPAQQAFLLEPMCILAGTTKITVDMGDYIWFWVPKKQARDNFNHLKVLSHQMFDYVDWEMIYGMLRDVPMLLQLWACKQVMGVAGTMEWDKLVVQKYPSCMVEWDTCAHVLYCCHQRRVETLRHTLELMEEWLVDAETDPDLLDCIMEYAHGKGGRSMENICSGLGQHFMQMAREQDAIGWWRCMEGMTSKSMRAIKYNFHYREGTSMKPEHWAQGLILKRMEVTHGQWIYCNIQIHDAVVGTQVTLRKEAILKEIEEQMELGEAGLQKENNLMLEVNLGDMENSSGEQEEYWLLAIKALQVATSLTGWRGQSAQQMAVGDRLLFSQTLVKIPVQTGLKVFQ